VVGLEQSVREAVRVLRSMPALNRPVIGSARRVAVGARRFADLLEKHGVPAGEVRVPLPNGQTMALWSDARHGTAAQLWWHGWAGYEPESVVPWLELASTADVVLDIGAHIGIFALIAAHARPGIRVVAFEPMPRAFAALEGNARRNPGCDITCVQAAVGDLTGQVRLYTDPSREYDMMATVVRSDLPVASSGHDASGDVRELLVDQVRLDRWLESTDIERVDLIKIDVEGAEGAVLRGMGDVLERDRPDLIVEVLSDDAGAEVSRALSGLGYEHFLLTPAGPVPVAEVSRHACLNHLFTRRAHLKSS
jgi:FkbM family methyltransferase